ncbi:MAG: isopeptide-forming domain-containing fimbrial protein [Coprobacillus sp.]
MALINKIDNTSKVVYEGNAIDSNTVSTLLLLPPTITKVVDKLTAKIGDVLTYTITVTNVSLSAYANIPFSDSVVDGATYVTDSFKVNGTAATPTIVGRTLSYTIANIEALGVVTIQFQVTITGS